jgi:hypothetical protein
MKKLIMSLVLVAACHTTTTVGSGPAPGMRSVSQPGAADAVSAVRGFLVAANEPNLQAMGVIFGDTQGPARDAVPRDELEKREVIMARCLRHDRYDIVTDAPSPGGGRNFVVNLVYKDLSRSSNFEVVLGPLNRWYVQKFDPVTLTDICARKT